jgi:hypothetical protein
MTRLIGREIAVDSRPRVVVGVMPASFRFLDEAPDLLLPDAAGEAAAAAWRQLA